MFNHNFFVILQRQSVAKELFEKHLSSHASEAVNVDSHARQVTQVGLDAAAPDLFDVAQMQVSIASVIEINAEPIFGQRFAASSCFM